MKRSDLINYLQMLCTTEYASYTCHNIIDKLGIPLIIVPNPATSSPPTRISRKSAIQAHCLHAK